MKSSSAQAECHSRMISSLVGAFVMLVVCFGIIIYFCLAKQIEIVIDGSPQTISTFAKTVGEVLEEEGIDLHPCDTIDALPESPLNRDQVIEITRAFQVQIEADGETSQIITGPLTVAEALNKAGIPIGEADMLTHDLNAQLTAAATIGITRVSQEYVTEEIVIEPPLVRQADNSLEQGVSKVISQGKSGLRADTYMITYEDGEEVSRELAESQIVQKPKEKVMAYGTISLASREGRSFEFKEARTVTATAYTHTGNRTATGTQARVGVIAVDPRVIPLHTEVYVEGYGFAVAEDTGGAIKGDKIDIYLETREACRSWGVRKVKIYILD